MCLLLTPLLLPIIIWLAEMLTLLRKNPLLYLAVFQDLAQHEHTVNRVLFVYENIHELNFRVNKFSRVPKPTKIFLHEIFVTLNN